jgi:membrane-associated phospholipid phosphatase
LIVAALLVLVVASALVVAVKAHPGPLPGDVELTLWWQHLVRPHRLETAALDLPSTVNFPIPATITVVLVVALFVMLRRWLDVAVALLTMEAADWSSSLINGLVHRPRPLGHGVFVERYIANVFSFPSGHVEHALAFLGIVLFLSFQTHRPVPWLWPVRLVLLALPVLQTPSRVLEGEHWPSDCLAGLIVGGFWLLVGIQAYRWAAQRWARLVPVNERHE